ncbi:YfiR family protein [Salinimonas lutimaris]|uniref:YfiR family protein n=1 Tax=Salinimonas lutimaris TaxID=914153 RepID=UPI00158671A7|nr:YfiR family protein [Salinimonas lutimaris]
MKTCLALMLAGLLFHLPAKAELKKVDKLKAAYIVNFTRFISWPDNQTMPLRLCIQDNPELSHFMTRLIASKNKKTNPLQVVSLSVATACDIAFLNKPAPEYRDIMTSTMVISDNRSVNIHQAVFTFFEQDNRLRFEVTLANARALDLSVSSELLKVATIR